MCQGPAVLYSVQPKVMIDEQQADTVFLWFMLLIIRETNCVKIVSRDKIIPIVRVSHSPVPGGRYGRVREKKREGEK